MIDKIKNFFGLSRIPFSKTIGVNELFISSQIREASARLELAVQTEDLTMVTGAVGCGKSTAIRYFIHQLDPNAFKVVYIPADNVKTGEIAKTALRQMQIQPPYQQTAALQKFKQTVLQFNREKNIKPVLVIDEVQELSVPALRMLKNMVNFQFDSENLLFILLCGQKEFTDTLNLRALESLKRRIRIQYDIGPLTLEETSQYITHQLKTCGLQKAVFSDDTKSQIYTISKGIISQINQLCFELIIAACAESRDIIEPSMIDRLSVNYTS